MTNPNVKEIAHHIEPSFGHDTFADGLPIATADSEMVKPMDHQAIQAARVAGLLALEKAGVNHVRPVDIQHIESQAMINVRTNSLN